MICFTKENWNVLKDWTAHHVLALLSADTKTLEALNCSWMLFYGWVFLSTKDFESSFTYAVMLDLAPREVWEYVFIAIGVHHLAALIVDKFVCRRVSAFISAMVWFFIAIGSLAVYGIVPASFLLMSMAFAMLFSFWGLYRA